jgi:galactosamine-6-phosphate isomerase
MPVKLVVFDSHENMSEAAGGVILSELLWNPRLIATLAAGETPVGAYAEVARLRRRYGLPFPHARVLKLDEWLGVPMDEASSCEHFVREHVLVPWGIAQENYIGFRGDLAEPDLECSSVREWLDREGPIDLAVLGLGVNGHLGFNEPGASLLLRPHAATLSEASRDHGMVSHRRSSIIRGITLGVGDLMAARRILLLVSGERKADQLAQLFAGSVTTQVPATLLNVHSNVGCYCDKAAAMRLPAEVTSRAG